jgi:hypothetical protein
MGQDGKRGYRFYRAECPKCKRIIAVSLDVDGKHVWFRRHNSKDGGKCPGRFERRPDVLHTQIRERYALALPSKPQKLKPGESTGGLC